MDRAGRGVNAAGRSQGIDDQVNLTQVLADGFQGLRLDFLRESVAVDVLGVEAGGVRRLREADRVVPARGGGPAFLGRALVEDAESGRV